MLQWRKSNVAVVEIKCCSGGNQMFAVAEIKSNASRVRFRFHPLLQVEPEAVKSEHFVFPSLWCCASNKHTRGACSTTLLYIRHSVVSVVVKCYLALNHRLTPKIF